MPFGPRQVIGVVWDARAARAAPPSLPRLKAVGRRLDAPPMPPALRQLVRHIAATTLHPLGSALRLALSVPAALEPPAPKLGLVAAEVVQAAARPEPARQRVLAALADGVPRSPAEIARRGRGRRRRRQGDDGGRPAGADPAAGAGRSAAAPACRAGARCRRPGRGRAGALRRDRRGGHSVTLLEGVPGAGKTEVYLEAVAAVLEPGRQVLVLLPEIALSAQLLERFAARFGRAPAVWHSELGAAARRRTWRRVAEGREPVVIGARSALFLPFPALGLIVVDEEHDASFKQEDGVPYQGRDMAIARARFEDCPAVLVSATPALETAWRSGPDRRPCAADGGGTAAAGAPRRRRDAGGRPGRPAARPAAARRLARARRCATALDGDPGGRRAGAAVPQPARLRAAHPVPRLRPPPALPELQRLAGAPSPAPPAALPSLRLRPARARALPECGTVDALVACGPGVERLADEVRALLPEARVAIMTSDSPASPSAGGGAAQGDARPRIDLLIGTQIIAKGHHFPDLTLVGVVDGDLGLSGGDLRAAER